MRYLTAGESHGPRLTAIIEGVPAGLPLTAEDINVDLKRRQGGYGRGGRMKIESDKVEITSGVRHGKTTGAPITLNVINKDHEKWLDIMAVEDIDDAVSKRHSHSNRGLLESLSNVGDVLYYKDSPVSNVSLATIEW